MTIKTNSWASPYGPLLHISLSHSLPYPHSTPTFPLTPHPSPSLFYPHPHARTTSQLTLPHHYFGVIYLVDDLVNVLSKYSTVRLHDYLVVQICNYPTVRLFNFSAIKCSVRVWKYRIYNQKTDFFGFLNIQIRGWYSFSCGLGSFSGARPHTRIWWSASTVKSDGVNQIMLRWILRRWLELKVIAHTGCVVAKCYR